MDFEFAKAKFELNQMLETLNDKQQDCGFALNVVSLPNTTTVTVGTPKIQTPGITVPGLSNGIFGPVPGCGAEI